MSLVKRLGHRVVFLFEDLATGKRWLGFDLARTATLRTTGARHTLWGRIGTTSTLGKTGRTTWRATGRQRGLAPLFDSRCLIKLTACPGIQRRSVIASAVCFLDIAVIVVRLVYRVGFGRGFAFAGVVFVGTSAEREKLGPNILGRLRTRRRVFFEQA